MLSATLQRHQWRPGATNGDEGLVARFQDLTEVMVASWILGGEDERIPTFGGHFDRALRTALEQGAFGDWGRELHFVDSRVGLRCVELPSLLNWAQRAQLTTTPDMSSSWTQVVVGARAARLMLTDLGVAVSEATAWGKLLRTAVVEVRDALDGELCP